MGASSWHYFTPYQPDAEAALQQLRNDVFARNDYSRGFGGFARANDPHGPRRPDPASFLQHAADLAGPNGRLLRAAMAGDYTGLSEQERRIAQQLLPMLQQLAVEATGNDDEPGDPPGSIDELLEMAAEDGTHSILDIQHTALQRDFAVALPMPASRIQEWFGTTEPTHEQVEEYSLDVAEELDRWEALYLTVFRDGKPHEYAFIGCSGD